MNKSLIFKTLIFLCTAFVQTTVQAKGGGEDDIRHTQLFNFDWKFQMGDVENAQDVAFDDANWRKLDLPHDFQIEEPWDEKGSAARGFKSMGVGWYRKTFAADPTWKGKRVFIDFEGIMLTGDVWLNGQKIGGTDYGYLGFEADISKLLKYDGNNVVAVRASTGKSGASRWYTGGGLYRDVHIFTKNDISIARHGVFVSTPEISASNAAVSVQVEVEGVRGKSLPLAIEAKIFAPDGRQVATTSGSAPIRSKKWLNEVKLPMANVNAPQLWSCETPNLYTAEVTLTLDGKVLDRVRETFGIRTLEFSPEFGFKLNGKKVLLKGLANHHDLGAVGVAAYERAIERQFKTLQAFGFNHVRTSHNPYSEAFLHMADKLGILVVDELFDKWGTEMWAGRIPWRDVWPTAIPEWVKRDRNHPSVILWSFGNELQIVENWAGYDTSDWGITTYRILDVMLKRYDPTRKTTVAMFPAHKGALTKNDEDFKSVWSPPELSTVTEIASYNYRYPEFKGYKAEFPNLIFYQSEAATGEMGKAFYGMPLDSVVGLAYWGAIEYWGESNGWPWKGWHYSFFNHTLDPFPQAYFIKSIYEDEPTVHIGVVDNVSESIEWNDVMVGRMPISSNWNRTPGSTQNVVTYTNADEVELFVNGKSQGVQRNNTTDIAARNAIFWKNVPYADGKIEAVARTQGKEVARHQLETTGKAVALKLVPETETFRADGMDLQYIRVLAVDSRGRTVPTATGEVTFDVSGAAKLIAVDNGDHRSNELFAGRQRMLFNGKALCILRSTRAAGKVTVKATVSGLKAAQVVLKTEK